MRETQEMKFAATSEAELWGTEQVEVTWCCKIVGRKTGKIMPNIFFFLFG